MFVQNHPGRLKVGFTPSVIVAAQISPCRLERILWKRGKSTNMEKVDDPTFVETGDECEVVWAPQSCRPLYIEKYKDDKKFGRMLILESNELVAIARCVDVKF